MKPIRLELQAFGPFVEKQTVDFEKLTQNGIFLIKGNTGSGKTTIFDAMTFALYGGGSGESEKQRNGRNDLEEWRCTQAPRSLATFISFTFSVHDRTYRFKRSLEMRRTNYAAAYEAGEILPDGSEKPFFTNPKKDDLTEKAAELIGLKKDQFRQVVLLPQGQFERFLSAPSKEKEEILCNIFSVDRWYEYARAFYDEAEARVRTLDSIRKEIFVSLSEEKMTSLTELNDRIELLTRLREESENAHALFDGKKKQEALTKERELALRFKTFHELEQRHRLLSGQKERIEEQRKRYDEAEKAEAVRVLLDSFENDSSELKTRENALSMLERSLPEKEKAVDDLRAENDKLQNGDEIAKLNAEIGVCKAAREGYLKLGELDTSLLTAENVRIRAERDYTNAVSVSESAVEKAANAKDAFDKADGTARDYRDRYYTGIYGEIASAIKDGEECPICGSRSHPKLAEKRADSVSKAEVDRAEEKAGVTKKAWEKAERDRLDADKEREKKKESLTDAEKKKESLQAEMKAARSALISGIADSTALESRIISLEKKAETLKNNAEAVKRKYDASRDALQELIAKTDAARTEKEKAKEKKENSGKTLEKGLADHGFLDAAQAKEYLTDAATRNRIHEDIVSYGTALAEAEKALEQSRKELNGAEEPDPNGFDARQKEIEKERSDYTAADSAGAQEIKRLSNKLSGLTDKQRVCDGDLQTAESDFAFAKKLRGDTGIGLRRYVLAIMFQQVISEANRMLEKVHGGRYRLFRTDERGEGNKTGLELKVFDSRCPEHTEGRSVGMLSGGEKFFVSLALSIGMSAVAQRSGIRIEALFIDEGFGTLDDGSIHDALAVLENVRLGHGMIGIISHVGLLEENIPTQLEVVKRTEGSLIKSV